MDMADSAADDALDGVIQSKKGEDEEVARGRRCSPMGRTEVARLGGVGDVRVSGTKRMKGVEEEDDAGLGSTPRAPAPAWRRRRRSPPPR